MMELIVQAGRSVSRRRKWTKVGIVVLLLALLFWVTWPLFHDFFAILSEARIIPIFIPYI